MSVRDIDKVENRFPFVNVCLCLCVCVFVHWFSVLGCMCVVRFSAHMCVCVWVFMCVGGCMCVYIVFLCACVCVQMCLWEPFKEDRRLKSAP